MTEKSLFADLTELPARALSEVVYQALAVMAHRALLERCTLQQLLEQVGAGSGEYELPEWRKRIAAVIATIESAEGTKLATIRENQLRRDRRDLDTLLFRTLRQGLAENGPSGKVLIERLHRQEAAGSRPSRSAAANGQGRTLRASSAKSKSMTGAEAAAREVRFAAAAR